MNDDKIFRHITALVDEEDRLRDNARGPLHEMTQLKRVSERLDQCWDLLRQRRARREFGLDPGVAAVRDIATVERYEG